MPHRSLAILLGPYRNLSTLTAAVLSLHPDIQVLNHAAERLWVDDEVDLIAHPDRATFDRFMEVGWALSGGGESGILGGSILHSHAYNDPKMQALYRARYGNMLVKPDAGWLVWKESMRVQNRLMDQPDLFARLCESLPEIKFILPMRNPLHCAISNQSTGHSPTLRLPAGASVSTVLDAVLNAFAWALGQRDSYPDRVFAFTQAEPVTALLPALAAFLGLPAPAAWLDDGAKAFVVRDRYKVPAERLEAYARRQVELKLGRWPELARALV